MDSDGRSSTVSGLKALGIVWDVVIAVAVPTTLFALAGRWIDVRYATSPWGTIVGLIFALTVSGLLVYRKATAYAEQMKSDHRK